mmetsp:Transcript_3231/g.7089  ORF Transcript_3231/g.7089 Transcript_3231/m.7089 type:complete len:246 (-) Transcript_3231:795-1532(-)
MRREASSPRPMTSPGVTHTARYARFTAPGTVSSPVPPGTALLLVEPGHSPATPWPPWTAPLLLLVAPAVADSAVPPLPLPPVRPPKQPGGAGTLESCTQMTRPGGTSSRPMVNAAPRAERLACASCSYCLSTCRTAPGTSSQLLQNSSSARHLPRHMLPHTTAALLRLQRAAAVMDSSSRRASVSMDMRGTMSLAWTTLVHQGAMEAETCGLSRPPGGDSAHTLSAGKRGRSIRPSTAATPAPRL